MSALPALPNPFDGNVMLDAWSAPAADVPSIHEGPFQQCLRALDSVSAGNPDSVLIYGPAGSGKTHLLARLQERLTLRCVLVAVKLQTNAQLIWQYVRRRLAADLLRRQQGLTQLQRLVAHRIAALREESPRQWVLALRVLLKEGDSVAEDLERVAQRLELGRSLWIVLEHLVHDRRLMDATAWLAGDSLPEAALARLGLGAEEQEDREDASRQVVTALCRLAGPTLPIVFCFDQIEALQQSPDDKESLFRFGRMAADLSEADRHVLLISCVQSAFLDLLNDSTRQADRDRIFKRRCVLEPLSREQVEALLLQRLDRIEPLRLLRAVHPDARFHPFDDALPAKLAQIRPCLPRRVLAAAAAAFDRLQRGEPAPRAEPAPEPARVERFLGDAFAARRGAAAERVKPEESRDTLMHGLPMLWALRGHPASAARPPGGDLLLPSPRGPISVTICNETNMNSLAARLRQLLQAAEARAPSSGRVIVVRDPRLPITRTARKTQEYLTALEERGARIVRPSVEALAALEALRSLLSDARAGDLAERGEAIPEGKVSAWLSAHLDDALADLVDTLDERDGRDASPATADESRLIRDLDDIVLRRFIAPLEAIASELGCSTGHALAVARRSPDRIGVLDGPPVVVFARMPAESLDEVA